MVWPQRFEDLEVKAMKIVEFTSIPLAARPETHVWQVLIEQAKHNRATLLLDGKAYFVQFPDEPDPIPFSELAYNHEIGLYDKRKFS